MLVHTHTGEPWSNAPEVRTLSWMDDKPKRWCSEHPSRSQIATAMATTITANSLLPRPKLDCDRGYDVAVKGASVVVDNVLVMNMDKHLSRFIAKTSSFFRRREYI